MRLSPCLKMVMLSVKSLAQSAVLDADQASVLTSSDGSKTPPYFQDPTISTSVNFIRKK